MRKIPYPEYRKAKSIVTAYEKQRAKKKIIKATQKYRVEVVQASGFGYWYKHYIGKKFIVTVKEVHGKNMFVVKGGNVKDIAELLKIEHYFEISDVRVLSHVNNKKKKKYSQYVFCTKTLKANDGEVSFTKDVKYKIAEETKVENEVVSLSLINNFGKKHFVSNRTGGWLKYFKTK